MKDETPKCKSKFLQKFDLFSVKYGFRINEQNGYRSNLGGLIFIIYLIFTIIHFSLSFNYFWNGKDYSINFSITKSNENEMDLKMNNFSFGFKKKFSFIKDFVQFEVIYQNGTTSSKKINYYNCTIKDFPMSNKTFTNFRKLDLKTYQCFNFENLKISGETYDDNDKNISIVMYLKFNSSSWEKIQKKFTKKNIRENAFRVIWIDKSIKVDKNENPSQNLFMAQSVYLEINKTKQLDVFVSKMDFSDDNNIFYPQKIITNLSLVDRIKENSYYSFLKKTDSNKNIFKLNLIKVNLLFSQKTIKLERKYKKLSEFLAEFGSINSNFLLLLTIFANFINEFWAQQKLINRLFKFREHLKVNNPNEINVIKTNFRKNTLDHNDSFDSNKIISPNKNEIGNSFQSFKEELDIFPDPKKEKPIQYSIEMSNKKEKITPIQINLEIEQRGKSLPHSNSIKIPANDDKLKELEKIVLKMKKPIIFSCYDVILRSCCFISNNLKLKNELYEKALKKTNNYLDIVTYLKKMQEIDILKYLVLDKDQVKLFNFLTIPSISVNSIDSDDYHKNFLKTNVSNLKLDNMEIHELIKTYSSIKNKNDELNHRLLKLFDHELDYLIVDC